MGGVLSIPALSFLEGCQPQVKEKSIGQLFNTQQKAMVAAISSLIIPNTSTPGAIEADVPEFIYSTIADCYAVNDQQRFAEGLDEIDQAAKETSNSSFLALDEPEQIKLLTELEIAARKKLTDNPLSEPHALLMLKELTLIGYFTSEIGATQALEYVPVPGSYNGCLPIEPEHKTWAV
ncbi:twin-arginine translocation pathway signal [Flammeovirgaceae bacterium 311]|nr:twin-arginine translocation pathway signal [Flammeovirgaceae bacterium 311]